MRIVLVTFSVAALVILPMTAARAESDIERAIANGIASNLKESGRLHGYKIGIKMKVAAAMVRPVYIPASRYFFGNRLPRYPA